MRQILRNWLYVAILFIGSCCSFAQCPAGNVFLDTQASVDNFIIQYPNCTSIDGLLKIQGLNSTISNFNGLQNITQTKGLHVEYTAATNLNGLHNITVINGELRINNNNNLTELSALEAITQTETLLISSNNNLTDIDELSNLTTVTYFLDINQNDDLVSLEGLSGLTTVGDLFKLRFNNALTNLSGLENLNKVGSLVIENNAVLTNLDAFSGLTQFTGAMNQPGLLITGNSLLNSLTGLSNLTTIHNGNINISSNSVLSSLEGLDNINPNSISGVYLLSSQSLSTCSVPSICEFIDNGGMAIVSENAVGCRSTGEITAFCGEPTECPAGDITFNTQTDLEIFQSIYPNCTVIHGDLNIVGWYSDIESLTPLENIESVLGDLNINMNVLTNLEGLNSLTQIAGDLKIIDNPMLTSIEALSSLESINNHAIIIQANTELTSLAGLENIDPNSINQVVLESSQNLSTCNVLSICTYLSFFESNYTILGNATGCNSQEEIIEACEEILPTCPTGDLSFTNQAELDHFLVQYPNCTVLPGNVYLGYTTAGPSSINDLTPFQNITEITGHLQIEWTSLPSLNGLSNLTKIDGALVIDRLGSLEGIQNLTSVESLEFLNNPAILTLEGLENLRNIKSHLFIQGSSLTSLKGLEGLTEIPIALSISSNPNLINLEGLNNITKISHNNTSGELYISGNDSLENFEGLNNLTTLGYGQLHVRENNSLKSFDGLENLTTIGGTLRFDSNPVLESIEALSNLTQINLFNGPYVQIHNNPMLTSISAFHNITRLGSLSIQGNHSLTNLNGLENVVRLDYADDPAPDEFIGTSLQINGNNNLVSVDGLRNLTFVGNNFHIMGNPLLTSLQPFSSLVKVGCDLRINGNYVLTSLQGLENIEDIGTYVHCPGSWLQMSNHPLILNVDPLENLVAAKPVVYDVQNNAQLQNLDGLENIAANQIEFLWIKNSPNLVVCNQTNICEYLSDNGVNDISGNAEGCSSPEEIIDICRLSVDEINSIDEITLYPVPTKNVLNVSIQNGAVIEHILIYDLNGKLIYQSNNDSSKFDISHLAKGTYLVSVKTSKGVHNEKIIKK
ncbi:T9SS type A sorting domain-containing protein [Moheibacter sediminis]|uniref:Por secretion system C-terminal sorting domain-containing protein n=1 Tax=Moheibacter sediminis TaxID=1434700 RepID=A0A1W2BVK2_9FLAO|nr:T9SS type A sorting domain-containing protein [Moheibacter sediminis]SMC77013.1 Por secretion system C-terminal sorting domain-containing protein [Moheibacter sediminis]